MTITTTKRKAGPYYGDSTSLNFPFEFRVFEARDLCVIYSDQSGAEHKLTLIEDYVVEMNEDQETLPGGNVVLNEALQQDCTLTITSAMAYVQPTKLTNHGGFYPTVINDALDRLTIFVQQLEEQVDRSVKVTVSSELNPNELVTSIYDSVSAAKQSADAAKGSEKSSKENADIAQEAVDSLEGGLLDLNDVKTAVDVLREAIVPATAAEVQAGETGKLIDAAELKNTIKNAIASQQDIQANRAEKLVDAAGLVKYMSDRFAIIYPNGGTEERPAHIAVNNIYVLQNPFLNKRVRCYIELLCNGVWAQFHGMSTAVTSSATGVYCGLHIGVKNVNDIVIRTAFHYLVTGANVDANPWNMPPGTAILSAPCRVVVECVG